ncbi:Bax inhibitor-1/YccA family protein [Spirillospora sp. NPDC047279]|uniref:Bax inhibitor-1/YccA family protein n=1 Tax=Spirillospora sp. NPDC047279 TaxID=3155478 RepID=UPI0033CBC9C8
MESRNPAFRGNAFGGQGGGYGTPPPQGLQDTYGAPAYAPPATTRPMTYDDVVIRSFLSLLALCVTGALTWAFVPIQTALAIAVVAFLLQLGVGLYISFSGKANAPLVLTFSAVYGVGVGAISHYYENLYNGIVLQAVIGTALAFAGVLAVHSLKIIRVTPKFARYVCAAGFALLGLMLVNFIAAFFVDGGIGIRDGGPIAIVFSVIAILVGCFFLLLDFDSIEQGVRAGAPEKFAWYCAFGLTLSLVWIYLEILRLLSYFRD